MLRRQKRALAITLIAAVAIGAFALFTHSDDPDVPLINHERTSRGIHALIEDTSLDALALSHSQAMASANKIYHDPDTANHAGVYVAYGENVGTGPTLQDIHDAYMNSPEHRSNILDPIFDHVGAAEVSKTTANGVVVYNTEIFVERPRSSPPPAEHTTAPAPTHRAKPKPKPTPPVVCAVLPTSERSWLLPLLDETDPASTPDSGTHISALSTK